MNFGRKLFIVSTKILKQNIQILYGHSFLGGFQDDVSEFIDFGFHLLGLAFEEV